jgi:uncharacterized membrane protein YsdA (DUF1294 family)/cold shock CspA family protein
MRLQGKISDWNDDKGFGFVEQNGGGERAFVHIQAFKSRSRRPSNGDIIIYELVRENNTRYKAVNIQFTRENKPLNKRNTNNTSDLGTYTTLLFLIGMLVSITMGKLPLVIAGVYLVMSIVTFIAYALDKSAAKSGCWRTKESTLHLFAVLGGWPGALWAQTKLRHKSSKQEFKHVYKATVLLNVGVVIWLHTESGTNIVNNITSFTLNLL